jgi:hypothetical protein
MSSTGAFDVHANDDPADGKGYLVPRQTRSLFENSALRSYHADDDRVVEDTIEHRHSERAVAGESRVPTAEGEIGSEDHRAAFVPPHNGQKHAHGEIAPFSAVEKVTLLCDILRDAGYLVL